MTNSNNKTASKPLVYTRVLLKISGEALMGEQNYGIDVNVARSVAEELKAVHDMGVQVAVVVGGGNIFRGVSKSAGNMDRSSADYIGMLATVMNAVVLQDALEKIQVDTRVLSAVDIPQWRSRLSAAVLFVTWKRVGLSYSRLGLAIPISPPTRLPPCEL